MIQKNDRLKVHPIFWGVTYTGFKNRGLVKQRLQAFLYEPHPVVRTRLIVSIAMMLICGSLLLIPLDALAAPAGAPSNQTTSTPPTITVQKQILPANDPGKFDLLINGNPVATNVGNGGSSGAILVNSGQYVISEVAAAGSTLAAYDTIIRCVNQTNQLLGSISGASSFAIEAAMNQHITCTITNVRKNALVLDKVGDVSSVAPGGIVAYSLHYTNTASTALTGIMISETIPDHSTFDSSTSSSGWVCAPDRNPGSVCNFEVGTVAAGATNGVPIRFAVKVDLPLTGVNVNSISNFATISDDSGQHVAVAVEETPLISTPQLIATKQDSFVNDADGDGVPGPGDTIAYQVKLENVGNTPISSILLSDSPDQSTTIVSNSVSTSRGTVLGGNSVGDVDVRVDVGTLAVGSSVVIDYQVTINLPLPANITQIQNQALITSNELPAISTDDPDSLTLNDPTITSLSLAPIIVASQSDSLDNDADGDGIPSPGDTILIEVVISNIGNGTATDVAYSTPLESNVQLLSGSVSTTLGSTSAGNGSGDTQVDVSIGLLPPNGSVTIRYKVTINDPLPANIVAIQLQGLVSSDQLPDLLTDDPALPANQDPTSINLSAVAAMNMTKRDLLYADRDNDNFVSAGDILLYRLEIVNNGNAGSTDLQLVDSPAAYTTLITGSVQTTQGTILEGNESGDSAIKIALGSVAGNGGTIVVTYQVSINSVVPVNELETQASLFTSNTTEPGVVGLSDDPDTLLLGDVTITAVQFTSGLSSIYLPIIEGQQVTIK